MPVDRPDAGTIPRACRSPPSSSAAAAATPCRWSTRPSTGPTASTSPPPWARRPPPRPPARSARCAATRWPCCPSAATTSATTSTTGCEIGRKLTNPPRIFRVNWFRKDADGKFLWPGFGENMRVLKWIVDRCHGRASAAESVLGWMPRRRDLEWSGLDSVSDAQFAELMTLERDTWIRRTAAPRGALREALRQAAQGVHAQARAAARQPVALARALDCSGLIAVTNPNAKTRRRKGAVKSKDGFFFAAPRLCAFALRRCTQ